MTSFGWNPTCLTKDGKPWLPIMGEIHFSRYPHRYWREALAKMKAGGVEIVSVYVFWNHHEETHGEISWAGDRDIRSFVKLCKEAGLYVFLRPGPWCHGEARHGGFPDWLLEMDCEPRTNDARYMAEVSRFWTALYQEIGEYLYKNDGPIIGIQVENEYGHVGGSGGDEHIRALTELLRKIGFDAPYMTATGWGHAAIGDLMPVLGGYVEAPWDPSLKELPPNANFIFANKRRLAYSETLNYDPEQFPFLLAELGGGLQVTYNRRPRVSAEDTGAMSLVRLGSGANLLGYYVYHGGTNPVGKEHTQQECREVGNYCDLPALTYDFQAPIREYGQIAESYKEIRMLALFLKDFGAELAEMDSLIPSNSPSDPGDTLHLRTAVRAKENAGYLFINNYQRRRKLADHHHLHFHVGDVDFPEFDVLNGEYFFLPFHMKLGKQELISALATPLCKLRDGYVFYADRDPQYQWAGDSAKILTLTREQAKNATKVHFMDEYLIICDQPVLEGEDGPYCLARKTVDFKAYPELPHILGAPDGDMTAYTLPIPESKISLQVKPLMQTNYLYREYELSLRGEVAGTDVFLTIDYEGNQAELFVSGKKIADDYYRGEPWVVGLKRFRFPKKMLLRVFALEKGQPVFLDEPLEMENGRALRLNGVTAEEEFKVML